MKGWTNRQTDRPALDLLSKHTKEAYWKLQKQVLGWEASEVAGIL